MARARLVVIMTTTGDVAGCFPCLPARVTPEPIARGTEDRRIDGADAIAASRNRLAAWRSYVSRGVPSGAAVGSFRLRASTTRSAAVSNTAAPVRD
jgi:hypothetical protein